MKRTNQKYLLPALIVAIQCSGHQTARSADESIPSSAVPKVIVSTSAEPVAEGKFQPTWQSLQQYEVPEWFRDAKFGIWAHWGPQCEPEAGDWYARSMYQEGSGDNKFHVAHYGPPSKFGFKDVINEWHAENWDPEKLMALYKRAGAQYFFALANHHDNFDNYDSKYQPWNSVNIGPKKDLIGGWAKAARENGLRFGVSVHASHAWSWYEVAQGADKTGPLAGVPYDGKLTKADGKGLWWDGYDPQDLYAQSHVPGQKLVWSWDTAKGSSQPDQAYCEKFYNRTVDLINKYHPDLIYFDDTALPLWPVTDAGLKIAADLYNSNAKLHDGQNEAVLFGKILEADQRRCMVWDIERGVSDKIEPEPWQTDTCLGEWHYRRSIFEQHRYKTAKTVIHTLADIVSKNGNLLLNVPVRGDGTIDSDEVAVLEGVAAWMKNNSEAILGTRPWAVCGEGPAMAAAAPLSGQGFNEGKGKPFTAADIRFTTKGQTLYAITLGWPAGEKFTIRSLAQTGDAKQNQITRVELLGHPGELKFKQTTNGLVVEMPGEKLSDIAGAFKITGSNFHPVPVPLTAVIITPDAKGNLVLAAGTAKLHGGTIQTEVFNDKENIGYWSDAKDWVSWQANGVKDGRYRVSADVASESADGEIVVEIGKESLTAKVLTTSGWTDFKTISLGEIQIAQPGEIIVKLRAAAANTWKPVNLRSLTLTPQ